MLPLQTGCLPTPCLWPSLCSPAVQMSNGKQPTDYLKYPSRIQSKKCLCEQNPSCPCLHLCSRSEGRLHRMAGKRTAKRCCPAKNTKTLHVIAHVSKCNHLIVPQFNTRLTCFFTFVIYILENT